MTLNKKKDSSKTKPIIFVIFFILFQPQFIASVVKSSSIQHLWREMHVTFQANFNSPVKIHTVNLTFLQTKHPPLEPV